MKEDIKIFVGLDVHKDTIAVALAEAGRQPGRVVGTVAHDLKRLLKVLVKFGTPEQVHVVYEAGPDRLRVAAGAVGQRVCVRGDRALADSAARWRADQDRPA